jgi:hypothetical protein
LRERPVHAMDTRDSVVRARGHVTVPFALRAERPERV